MCLNTCVFIYIFVYTLSIYGSMYVFNYMCIYPLITLMYNLIII